MSDTKSKLYKCPYCPYTTKKNTNMTAHICIHTGEKPFSCPHCSRRFTQKGNLQSHMYTHTGEKPFACSYCPYRSTQKSNLKSHLFTHHPAEKKQISIYICYRINIYMLQNIFLFSFLCLQRICALFQVNDLILLCHESSVSSFAYRKNDVARLIMLLL